MKSRKGFNKSLSPTASLLFKGQDTEDTNVKINDLMIPKLALAEAQVVISVISQLSSKLYALRKPCNMEVYSPLQRSKKETGTEMRSAIDLFTDTAAILNYLDSRSIMGYPGGMSTIRYTRSVFTRAFRTNFFV